MVDGDLSKYRAPIRRDPADEIGRPTGVGRQDALADQGAGSRRLSRRRTSGESVHDRWEGQPDGDAAGRCHQPTARQHLHEPIPAGVFVERGKDREFAAQLVNYADDFVILSRGCAKEALEWTDPGGHRASLNETKTCVRNGRREHFDFLGYTFGPGRRTGRGDLGAKPSKKAVRRLKERGAGTASTQQPGTAAEVVRAQSPSRRDGPTTSVTSTRVAHRTIDSHVYERCAKSSSSAMLTRCPRGASAPSDGTGVRLTRAHLAQGASSWPRCREPGVKPVGDPCPVR